MSSMPGAQCPGDRGEPQQSLVLHPMSGRKDQSDSRPSAPHDLRTTPHCALANALVPMAVAEGRQAADPLLDGPAAPHAGLKQRPRTGARRTAQNLLGSLPMPKKGRDGTTDGVTDVALTGEIRRLQKPGPAEPLGGGLGAGGRGGDGVRC